jgi:hypothetical protein
MQVLSDLKAEEKARTAEMKQELDIATLRGAKDREILETEIDILDVQKEALLKQKALIAGLEQNKITKDKIRKLDIEILDKEREITLQIERQALATNALARWTAKLRLEAPATMGDVLHQEGGLIDTILESGTSSLETAMTDITSLFARQRQEAAALEQQLEGLNVEYQQAMSEGNIERARQIGQQMSTLRNQIDELSSPLANIGKAFKSFSKLILEELQKVIIKMLVAKIIMAAIGFGSSFAMEGITIPHIPAGKHGGLFPGGTFENLRKFAKGGITGGAGLAILGDNPSGKELVIPSENIKEDEVSGFTRERKEQQPINIINIMTEQDIANAMANTSGQRVIINTIGADIGKRGPTYRAIKT